MAIPIAAAAGIAQGIGSFLSGKSKAKAAKELKKSVDNLSNRAVEEAHQDQFRAIEYRAGDETRLREATGYDLVKLRDDATKAGFNPLTVLNATGGAGYDGRGAVLTTPFVARAGDYWNKVNSRLGAGAAVVETAGYLGDAISAGSSSYFSQLNMDAANMLDRERTAALSGQSTGGGGGKVVSTPFAPTTRKVDARPASGSGTPFTSRSGVTVNGAGRSPFWVKDRPTVMTDIEDLPLLKTVTLPSGSKITTVSTDVLESEVGETLNDAVVLLQWGADEWARYAYDPLKRLGNQASPNRGKPGWGTPVMTPFKPRGRGGRVSP